MKENLASAILMWIAAVTIGLLVSWPVQWLWNYVLVGTITGVNEISFWQTYGLFILIRLITINNISKSE